jgi:hypothetical protein
VYDLFSSLDFAKKFFEITFPGFLEKMRWQQASHRHTRSSAPLVPRRVASKELLA